LGIVNPSQQGFGLKPDDCIAPPIPGLKAGEIHGVAKNMEIANAAFRGLNRKS
jgi:hypothetical protein